LVRHVDELAQPEIRPSAIVNQLQGTSELALLAAWYISEDKQVRDHLQAFWSKWRLIQSIATGETLRQMGLKAGPCYRVILTRLRQAWLDELVQNEMEERQLLNRLIHEERVCDDRA